MAVEWVRLTSFLSDAVLVFTSMAGMYMLATPKPGWRRLVPLLFYAFAAVNLDHPSPAAGLLYCVGYILLLAFTLFSFEEQWNQVYVLTFLLGLQQLLIHTVIMGAWQLFAGGGTHVFAAPDAAGFWRVAANNLLVVALFAATIFPMRRLRFWKNLPMPAVWVIMAVDVVCIVLDEIWKFRDGGDLTPTPALAWDILWAVLLFGVAAGLVAALAYRAQKRQMQLMEQQLAHYHTLLDVWQETRSIRHDLENHLLTATALPRQDGGGYLAALRARIGGSPRTEWCENQVINAVLFNKTAAAKAAGKELLVNTAAARAEGVEGVDLASVLANLLDNAIEASPPEGCVEVDIIQRGRILTFKVENRVSDAHAARPGPFWRSEKGAGHGVGLVAARRAAARYGGTLRLRCENGVATATATMLAKTVET